MKRKTKIIDDNIVHANAVSDIPDVSIIITNYNYAKYLARCLRSCLSQKNVLFDIILVDDNSNDNTLEVILPFINKITFIKNEKNLGVAESSNAGFKASKAQFVVRVDADDFINSDMCYFLKTYLEANHDAFCVSCDYLLVDENENILKRKFADLDPISCGIMYRRDLLLELGGYNPEFRHKEEEEMRKRLEGMYKIHYLKIPFYRYRRHQYNKTNQPEYLSTKI